MMRLRAGSIALLLLPLAACAGGEEPGAETLDPTFGEASNSNSNSNGSASETSNTAGDGDGDGTPGDGDGTPGDGDGAPPENCGNGAIDPGEECDSGNIGNATCEGEGFGSGGLSCNPDCTLDTSNCNACGNGMIDDGEECDGDDLGANTDCADLMLGQASEPLGCTDACTYDFGACSGCGDGMVTAPEECEPASEFLDKAELNGATCMSLGFDDGLLDCTAGCTFNTASCYSCGDAQQQGQEQCDGADFNGQACSDYNSMNGNPFNQGSLMCTPECTIETGNCSLCGDGVISGAEVCDGGALDGETCQTQGYDGGQLACNNNCTGFNVANCTDCGDSVVEGNEQCDFNNLNGQTCQGLGFAGGSLSCSNNCTFNTSMCTNNTCGDGVVNGMDQCDCGNQGQNCTAAQLGNQTCIGLGHDGGQLACNSPNNCTYNQAGCYDCGDGVINPGEQCDGNNFGGQTCQSQGFPGGGMLSCTNNCSISTQNCVNVPNPYTICINPNLGIPDNASTPSIINNLNGGTITDVNLTVNMLHTWVGDTSMTLNHGGVTRTVYDRPGVPNTLYGCDSDNVQATFDDSGAGNAENTCNLNPPAIGSPPSFFPVNLFNSFNGQNMSGNWTLTTTDAVGGDTGTLVQWCLIISWQ